MWCLRHETPRFREMCQEITGPLAIRRTLAIFAVGSSRSFGTIGLMSSLAPGFLVAAPILRDPNFAGTVVLMVEHSEQGALGFVVNRVASAGLRKVLGQLGIGDTPVKHEVPVMVGGPVSPQTGWIVFEAQDRKPEDRKMIAGRVALLHEVIARGLAALAKDSDVSDSAG